MSVAQFVAGVDRLLTRGHGLFPGSGGGDGEVFAAGGGDKPAVPPPPGGSGLSGGAGAAGGSYGQTRSAIGGVDVDTAAASGDGGAVADAGRASSGAIRDQARAVAAASAPLGNSPAGAQLVVATMDQHMEAMQRQLDATTAQNRLLALRLRELAAAYRSGGGAGGGGGGSPLSALRGLSMPSLGGAGGGLSGLSGLAGLPGSFLAGHGGSGGHGGGGAIAGTQVGDVSGRDLPPGVGNEKGLQKFTLLAERAVSAAFPEIKDIGGVRADSLKWHPNGQAIDVMIPNPTSPHGKALGNAILRFALQHSHEFSLNHAIWQQTMYNPDGSSSRMEDRGSPTQNHMDHVHIATNGGGFPHGGGGEVYRL